jgi:hypothetical protein
MTPIYETAALFDQRTRELGHESRSRRELYDLVPIPGTPGRWQSRPMPTRNRPAPAPAPVRRKPGPSVIPDRIIITLADKPAKPLVKGSRRALQRDLLELGRPL